MDNSRDAIKMTQLSYFTNLLKCDEERLNKTMTEGIIGPGYKVRDLDP